MAYKPGFQTKEGEGGVKKVRLVFGDFPHVEEKDP